MQSQPLPILAEVRDPVAHRLFGVAHPNLLPVDQNLTAQGWARSQNRLRQLRTPGAYQPCQPEDLARPDGKAHTAHPAHLKQRGCGRRFTLGWEEVADRTAHHKARKLRWVGVL